MSDAPNIIKKEKYIPGIGSPSGAQDSNRYENSVDYSYPRVQNVNDVDSRNFKYGYEYDNQSDRRNDFFYQDPLFLSFDIILDTIESPLLTTDPLKSSLSDFFTKYGEIPSINNRIDIYNEFKDILTRLFNIDYHTIDRNKSYYINSVAGLDKMSARIVDYQKDKITITLNEDVTMISSYLSSLYNNLSYSYKDQRFIIPQNLLRFNMYLMISDLRNMPTLDYTANSEVVKNFIKSSSVYYLRDCNFNFFESRNFEDSIIAGGFDAGRQDKISNIKFDIYYKSIEHEIYNPFIAGEQKLNNKITSLFIKTGDDLNKHSVFNGNIKESQDIERLSRMINDLSSSNIEKIVGKNSSKELDIISNQMKENNKDDSDRRISYRDNSKYIFTTKSPNYDVDDANNKRKSNIKSFEEDVSGNVQYFLNEATARMQIINNDTGLIDDSANMFSIMDQQLFRSNILHDRLIADLLLDNLVTLPLRMGDVYGGFLDGYRAGVLEGVNENVPIYGGGNNSLNGETINLEQPIVESPEDWKIDTTFIQKTDKDLGSIILEPSVIKSEDLGKLINDTISRPSLDSLYIDSKMPIIEDFDLGIIDIDPRIVSEIDTIELYSRTTPKIVSNLGKLDISVNPHMVRLGSLYENQIKRTSVELGKLENEVKLQTLLELGIVDQSYTEKISMNLEKIQMDSRVLPIPNLGSKYVNVYNPRVFDLGVLFKEVDENNILESVYLYSKLEKFNYLQNLKVYNNSININKILDDVHIGEDLRYIKPLNMFYTYDNNIDILKTLDEVVLYNNDINKKNNLNFEKLYTGSKKEKEFENIILYDNSIKNIESLGVEYLYYPSVKTDQSNLGTINLDGSENKTELEKIFLYSDEPIEKSLNNEYLYSRVKNEENIELGKLEGSIKKLEGLSFEMRQNKSQAEYESKNNPSLNHVDFREEEISRLYNDKVFDRSYENKTSLKGDKIDQSTNYSRNMNNEYLYILKNKETEDGLNSEYISMENKNGDNDFLKNEHIVKNDDNLRRKNIEEIIIDDGELKQEHIVLNGENIENNKKIG